jgi:hypothetical protein
LETKGSLAPKRDPNEAVGDNSSFPPSRAHSHGAASDDSRSAAPVYESEISQYLQLSQDDGRVTNPLVGSQGNPNPLGLMAYDQVTLASDITRLQTPLDPMLFAGSPGQTEHADLFHPGHKSFDRDLPISIAPAMLDKSARFPGQEQVIWYADGKEMQIGGTRPPITKNPIISKYTKSERSVNNGQENLNPKRLPWKRSGDDLDDRDQISKDSDTFSRHKSNSTAEIKYQAVKRIKIVFREPSCASPPGPRDTIVGNVAVQPESDESTHPPDLISMKSYKRQVMAAVAVTPQDIDRQSYLRFLGSNAKQIMVRRKIDGEVKGIKFIW